MSAMVSLTLDDLFDDFADCSVSEWVDGWVVLRRATHEALQPRRVLTSDRVMHVML